MNQGRLERIFGAVAIIAALAVLILLLVPHGHAAGAPDLLAILPLLFVGVISPLSLLAPLANDYVGRAPNAPALPTRFQRPPPFALA